jgi:hypothetical protein
MKGLFFSAFIIFPFFLHSESAGLLCEAWALSSGSSSVPVDILDATVRERSLESFNPGDLVVASDHGENRIQFLLSFKYPVIPLESLDLGFGAYRLQGLDFAYDGLFDFYIWTRYSQPLVSRLQNPGLYFSFKAAQAQRLWDMDSFEAGWFHESNGQVVDTLEEYNDLVQEYGLGARDYISRGWDYWYLSTKFSYHPYDGLEAEGATQAHRTHIRLSFVPSLRIYDGAQGIVLAAEQNIFWEPQNPPSYIYDYDGLRALFNLEFSFPYRAFNYLGLSAGFRTGYNVGYFGQNWSKQFSITFKTWHLPWYLYYNNGYGPYISDYSSWSEGYGVGLRVW